MKKNTNQELSFYADCNKEFLEANLLLAKLRNEGVEIDDSLLEQMHDDNTWEGMCRHRIEKLHMMNMLGRKLYPIEEEVYDVIFDKLFSTENTSNWRTSIDEKGHAKIEHVTANEEFFKHIEAKFELERKVRNFLIEVIQEIQKLQFM